ASPVEPFFPPASVPTRFMKRTILEAVYQRGALWPIEPLVLPENARVRIAIEADGAALTERRWGGLAGVGERFQRLSLAVPRLAIAASTLELALFCGALLVYGLTHLWALDQFPVYFFGDEASIGVFA